MNMLQKKKTQIFKEHFTFALMINTGEKVIRELKHNFSERVSFV